jgi:hypothetical protein
LPVLLLQLLVLLLPLPVLLLSLPVLLLSLPVLIRHSGEARISVLAFALAVACFLFLIP